MLRGAVQEHTTVVQRWPPVVVQQTLFPDLPRPGVLQLGNRSVQQRNGCPRLVVFCHPVHCLVDAVRLGVHQAVTQIILRLEKKFLEISNEED